MDVIETLRNLNVQRPSMDELMFLHVQARLLVNGYAEIGAEAPTWLADSVAALGKEVRSRYRDQLEAKLKAAEARRATLRTEQEKRREADAEIARLQKALGQQ